MPRFRSLLERVPSSPNTALIWLVAVAAAAAGQARGAPLTPPATPATPATPAPTSRGADTPLHVPANRFDFVSSRDTQPLPKPLAVHNGGTAPLTDVRVTGLTYADSARASGWLVALPRQSSVAPNELATIGTLCVDPAGLPSGTYQATAGVSAREVPEPVAITITLVVKDAGRNAGGARPAARCRPAADR